MRLEIDIDLLFVSVSILTIGILGFLIFINQRKSITNITFLAFSLLTGLYGLFNYINYQVRDPEQVLWFLRLTIFFAVWHAFSLFQLFYVFPRAKGQFPNIYKFILIPIVLCTSVLTLTPLIFSEIKSLAPIGQVTNPERGPAIALFGLVTFGLVIGAIYLLIKKTLHAQDLERLQYRYILIGTIITFALILCFNVILPVIFNILTFVPFAPIFIFPFIVCTAYAIIKHHLFNIKVIATELLAFALWLTLLVRLVTANTLSDMILNGIVFLATVVLGIFLIRSVLQEVRTREKMSQLALDLEVTNHELKRLDEAKSDFISIASHQLRTPLSIIKGYISMMREGTYGPVDKNLTDPLHKVYVSNERLINLVSDLLDLSRMERGKMQYTFEPIRFGEVVDGLVADFEMVAKKKGLGFSWKRDKINDLIKGDANKLRQIALNLIDNAIKYTAAGRVDVHLAQEGNTIRFLVTDTGPGLTSEEAHALFQKFSRGREEKSVHTEGLGLGLYVAKLIAQAHGGELSVTSPGKGQGSTFSLSLPIYREATENFKKFTSEI